MLIITRVQENKTKKGGYLIYCLDKLGTDFLEVMPFEPIRDLKDRLKGAQVDKAGRIFPTWEAEQKHGCVGLNYPQPCTDAG